MEQMSYTRYLSMKMVPSGAILNHIIQQRKCAKNELASKAQMVPQRLNDLIHGTRRFTVATSMALENALGIDVPGFFYLLQANHDVYLATKEATQHATPDLSLLSKTTFWDVNLERIDWARCKAWAIRRVLEYGTSDEIRELDRFYGHEAILAIFKDQRGFRLYEQVKVNFEEALS